MFRLKNLRIDFSFDATHSSFRFGGIQSVKHLALYSGVDIGGRPQNKIVISILNFYTPVQKVVCILGGRARVVRGHPVLPP